MTASLFLSESTFRISAAAQSCHRLIALVAAFLVLVISGYAQPASEAHPGDPQARVIEGVVNTTVFGMGQSIRITGTVKEGAIAFGGDVIIEGVVDGDVAAMSVADVEGRAGQGVVVNLFRRAAILEDESDCLFVFRRWCGKRWLRLCAALAMRYGIPEAEALKMVTSNAAEIARVADRVGSIAVGKDADLVIFNGPWYEPKSRVDLVIGDGRVIYDRAKEAK